MKKIFAISFMFVGLMGLQACSKEEKPKVEETSTTAVNDESSPATLMDWTQAGNEAAAGADVGSTRNETAAGAAVRPAGNETAVGADIGSAGNEAGAGAATGSIASGFGAIRGAISDAYAGFLQGLFTDD